MQAHLVRQSYAEQLAERLRLLIESGQWRRGQRVPTIRKLAGDYDVSVNTALAALRILEKREWIERKPSGTAVVSGRTAGAAAEPAQAARPSELQHIALIGSCSGDRTNGWGLRILSASETSLAENGQFALSRIPSFAGEAPEKELNRMIRQMEALAPSMAGAVIYFDNPHNLAALSQRLDRMGLPWVTIYRPGEQVTHNFVSADNVAAGKVMGQCFLLEQIERVVVLSPDLAPVVTWTQKVTGLVEAFLHAGRPLGGIQYLRCRNQSEEEGYAVMRDYLARGAPPQAVVGMGDFLSIGAMRACRDQGLRIPEDVSVVGTTGLDVARFTSPPMAVVAQPMEEIGQSLARMLLRMIQTGERRLPGEQIPGKLIPRESLKISETTRRALAEEGWLDEPAAETSDKRETPLAASID